MRFFRTLCLATAVCAATASLAQFSGSPMVPQQIGPPTPFSLRNVAVGDSITAGAGVAPYGILISRSLNSFSSNQGVSGDGWNFNVGPGSLITLGPTNVDPLRTALGAQPYLILFAGTNDIVTGGSTGAQTYGFFQTYISARLAAGWSPSRIIVVPMLPRGASFETDRTTYNSDLVSGASTYGYSLARVDLDVNMGCASCNTNPTYYQADQIHPTATGQQIIANLVCLQMQVGSATCPAY